MVLLPRTYALAMETLACVLPQDDSPWRDTVNRVLIDLFTGVEDSNSRYDELYERWFGRHSEIFYPLDRDNRNLPEHRLDLGTLRVRKPAAAPVPARSGHAQGRRPALPCPQLAPAMLYCITS